MSAKLLLAENAVVEIRESGNLGIRAVRCDAVLRCDVMCFFSDSSS